MKERDANDILREEGTDALRKWSDQARPAAPNGHHCLEAIGIAFLASEREKRKKPDGGDINTAGGISLDDFLSYLPMHNYIFVPSGDLWPAGSVDARLPPVIGPDNKPIAPSDWLDANARVEQMTWAPGEPMLIENRLIADGGWIKRADCTVFNLYRPSIIVPRAGDVTPWLDLVRKVFPNEADHIVFWLAHRVQRAHEKINHALVLGGKPGIGKDTILEPVKQAIGPWNFAEVSPKRTCSARSPSFASSVILRVSEARDLGEFDRFAFL